ncbi:GT-D fold domain-containing glycosyltransferase [Vibrio superstes]|nr:GT-D fold domain-containing glycosyltransferase [Vibrio superstes]
MTRLFSFTLSYIIFKLKYQLNILTKKETIILSKSRSISRFGDGEFLIMNGGSIGFQEKNKKLAERLQEVLLSNEVGHICCIPGSFSSLKDYKFKNKIFWIYCVGKNKELLRKLYDVKRNCKFGDANFTRFYMSTPSYLRHNLDQLLNEAFDIWKDKRVLVVEGNGTRLGVGNDLFKDCQSVERIICRNKNAFDDYTLVLEKTLEYSVDFDLVLIALGPTATVLAYDLAKKGIHAIDIGHFDIEYEWLLKRAEKKVAIENKNVNEADSRTVASDNSEDAMSVLYDLSERNPKEYV